MTADEERRVNANIEKLAEEMRVSFHKVYRDIAQLASDHELVVKHELELSGIPGDDRNKGALRNLDSHNQSRRTMRAGLTVMGSLVVGIILWLVKKAFGF